MRCRCFGSPKLQTKKGAADAFGETERELLQKIRHFPYSELKAATNDFSQDNKIGRGGFGSVYKGVLKDGVRVAVKTLAVESKQGMREFLTEINIISNVRHPNLVQLIGCCAEGPHRVLVYEYLENSSLDRALLGYTSDRSKLDWGMRSAICLGIARGLAFLHEEIVPHIVHRDIKASNILLDKDYSPKIGDFGLAKLFPDDITHISTRIAGTTGYLAPEYAMGGHLTKRADVYSFGVLILESISGRSSTRADWGGSQKLLLEWAWQLHEEGRLLELVDPHLKDYAEKQVLRYAKTAFFCTQAAASRRPLMSQVVDMLTTNVRLNEKQLTPPGFFPDSVGSSTRTIGSTSQQSSFVPPVTISDIAPR